MQLKHIEYFVKTSEYHSFNEAAKNLFISQPSLSAAIATLEQELGYPLFIRSKSGIILTPEGKQILPDAKQMLEIQNKWISLGCCTSTVKGQVKITAPDIICSTILLDMLLIANQKYPDLQITLRGEPPKLTPPPKTNMFLSLALNLIQPFELSTKKELYSQNNWLYSPISDEQSLIFMNTSHPLSQENAISINQLSSFNLVTYKEYMQLPYSEIFSYFSKSQIMILPTREAMFNFIAKNSSYIGIFSSICINHCSYINDGIICYKTISDYPMPLKLAFFSPVDKKDDKLVTIIKNLILESL